LSSNRVDPLCGHTKSLIWTVCAGRRTIMDALAVLESEAAFGEEDIAEIRVGLMPLAPRKHVGLVQTVFDVPCSERSYAVPLPSAEFFRAYSIEGQRERYGIELLDRGIVDARATVRLADGKTVHATHIEPVRLPLNPTELDWRIVHRQWPKARLTRTCFYKTLTWRCTARNPKAAALAAGLRTKWRPMLKRAEISK